MRKITKNLQSASLPGDDPPDSQDVLVFGAGCIGRGLLGELAASAGRPLVLVESNKDFAEELRQTGTFTVRQVGRSEKTTVIQNFKILNSDDWKAIGQAIKTCCFAATAVGGAQLKSLARQVAGLLPQRISPLNILICENWPNADQLFAEELVANGAKASSFSSVPVSVERMVQSVPGSLDLIAESNESAFLDRAKWLGEERPLEGLILCDDFRAYYARKLYMNNAGHALLAYGGALSGYRTLVEALEDQSIRSWLIEMLNLSVRMLEAEYGMDRSGLLMHMQVLLQYRFSNRALADKVDRVARGPLRKLGPNERLTGLLRLLVYYNLPIRPVCRLIVAAMRYTNPEDKESIFLQRMIESQGPGKVLRDICQIMPNEPCFSICMEEWNSIPFRNEPN